MRKLIGPLISVHRTVLFISDVYCFFDPPIHSITFSVDDLGLDLLTRILYAVVVYRLSIVAKMYDLEWPLREIIGH